MILCGAIVNEVLGVRNTTMVVCSWAGLYLIRLEPMLICWYDTGYSLSGTSYRSSQSLISGNPRHQINIQAKWSHFKEGMWISDWNVWPKPKAEQDHLIRIATIGHGGGGGGAGIAAIVIICWLSSSLLILLFPILWSVIANTLLTMAPMLSPSLPAATCLPI